MGVSSKQALVDGLDWSQELLKNGGLEMARPAAPAAGAGQARGGQSQQRQQLPPLRCPRCSSNNTKFCYYNNYSKSQPRHFCKACRRHWTEGGTLRNVPVGGGRKNKRSKPATTATATANIGNGNNNNNNNNSINTSTLSNRNIVNGLTPAIHQQQKLSSLPFGAADSSGIFPDILRQVLLRPPQPQPPPPLQLSPPSYGIGGSFMGSLPSSHEPPVSAPQFGAAKPAMNSFDINAIYPFSVSTSTNFAMDTSWHGAALPLLPASGGGGVGPSSGYWSGWDDEIADLVTPERDDSQHP